MRREDRERAQEQHEQHEQREMAAEHVREGHPGPGLRVRVAPPPMRQDVRPAAPSPRHVWRGGYWGWEGGRHVWLSGRWDLPPAPGQVWVEGRWLNDGGEWGFTPGYWSGGPAVVNPIPPAPAYAPPGEIMVTVGPRRPRPEVMAPQPGPGYFWVAGNWQWDGRRQVWVPGHWEAQRPGWVWEPVHWQRGSHQWRYRPGHWRPQ
jgi:hypothetical protein